MTTTGEMKCSVCHAQYTFDRVHICPAMTYTAAQQQAGIPFRCPVCNGSGTVPCNFYTQSDTTNMASPVQCKSCSGTGIVWSSK